MALFLGIDPGFAIVGFGLIESTNNKIRFLDYGIISTKANILFEERLHIIKTDLSLLLEETKPDAVGIEKLFFAKNTKTAIDVAQARGVILETVYSKNIPIFNFTPLEIKNNIAGYGSADKIQIQTMVKSILNLNFYPKPDDAADALAIAICTEKYFKSKI